MKLKSQAVFLVLLALSFSCESHARKENSISTEAIPEVIVDQDLSGFQKAYFASGCFWCVEAIFESVNGVKEVISGYSGGSEKNPTYEQVSYGRTGHAEAVEVYYDPKIVGFETLVQVFFGSHDPTTLNRQGPDRGAQYRSIAFYRNESEKHIIETYITGLEQAKAFPNPIVTQVEAFSKFWRAEDYHQNYERNHPENPYVQQISIPRLKRFKANFPELLKSEH
ncbi:MAG: peptide methionine sulfoxide reductase MsrA 2 [Bacteroidota bacterium]|jgi:peptide-methionine (S)-S-oxide reductase